MSRKEDQQFLNDLLAAWTGHTHTAVSYPNGPGFVCETCHANTIALLKAQDQAGFRRGVEAAATSAESSVNTDHRDCGHCETAKEVTEQIRSLVENDPRMRQ